MPEVPQVTPDEDYEQTNSMGVFDPDKSLPLELGEWLVYHLDPEDPWRRATLHKRSGQFMWDTKDRTTIDDLQNGESAYAYVWRYVPNNEWSLLYVRTRLGRSPKKPWDHFAPNARP